MKANRAKKLMRGLDAISIGQPEESLKPARWNYKQKFEKSDQHERFEVAVYPPEMQRYRSRWSHLHMGAETGEILWNEDNAEATLEELTAAKKLNLDCLTSSRGRHSLCELMPQAVEYRHAHEYGSLGWNSGSRGRPDHACE